MTVLSPMRTGRITGSRVAAVLGVDPYKSRDDVMREMVRADFDDPPEFEGNEATAWGTEHEEEARADYERLTGGLVLDAQEFIIHPAHDFLGVSPDGLVGADGLIEIKCPFRAKYRSVWDREDYYAQVQLQLACTGRAWAHFVIYRVGEPLIVEFVDANPEWLTRNLDVLAGFRAEFEAIIADPEVAARFRAPLEREDRPWAAAARTYYAAAGRLEKAQTAVDAAKTRLRELAGERSAKGCGVQVIRAERDGAVDWKALAGKYAPDADLEEFRKDGATVWTVRPVREKQ